MKDIALVFCGLSIGVLAIIKHVYAPELSWWFVWLPLVIPMIIG